MDSFAFAAMWHNKLEEIHWLRKREISTNAIKCYFSFSPSSLYDQKFINHYHCNYNRGHEHQKINTLFIASIQSEQTREKRCYVRMYAVFDHTDHVNVKQQILSQKSYRISVVQKIGDHGEMYSQPIPSILPWMEQIISVYCAVWNLVRFLNSR